MAVVLAEEPRVVLAPEPLKDGKVSVPKYATLPKHYVRWTQPRGDKGQGKGGGADFRSPFQAPNTLQSVSTARVLDLIGEGPIGGIIDPGGPGPVGKTCLKSVFFDDTPVMSADGSFNFEGVELTFKNGMTNQTVIPGFLRVRSETIVGLEVTKAVSVTQRISDANVTAARVKMRVPQLLEQIVAEGPNFGDVIGTTLSVKIEVSDNGGPFVEVLTDTFSGKAVSPYDVAYRFELNAGGAPWDVRLTRVTEDSATDNLQNRTFFSTLTEIKDNKLNYPDSALAGIAIDARQFGTRVPRRAYEIQGREILIPDNYDPVARTYSPTIWGGGFKTAVSDNPAWVLYDMLVNERFGLGKNISTARVDRFAFFEAGQYCDGLVDDGNGGTEPRHTFNAVINKSEDAYALLQAMASVFHGMIYWATGAVTLGQDAPTDTSRIVNVANTIGQKFDYGSPDAHARSSVIKVRWTDPADGFRSVLEYVEDVELISKFGVQSREVFALGATTRGQARRFGNWILDNERFAAQTVTYRSGLDQALLRPAEVVELADPDFSGVAAIGGRIASYSSPTVTLDREVTLDPVNAPYTLEAMLPDGVFEEVSIVVPVEPTTTDTITIATPYTTDPLDGAVWGLESNAVKLQKFRITSVKEVSPAEYEMTGVKHDPGKYARIEAGINVAPPPVSELPTGPLVEKVSDIDFVEALFKVGPEIRAKATFSWTPTTDPRMTIFEAQVFRPETGFWEAYDADRNGDGLTQGVSADVVNIIPGNYGFRVRGRDNFGRFGPWCTVTVALLGLSAPPADVTGFVSQLQTHQVKLLWGTVPDLDLRHYEIRYSPLLVGATWAGAATLIDGISPLTTSATTPAVQGSYLIKAFDTGLNPSKNAAVVVLQTIGDVNLNQVATLTENPTFTGTKTNVEVVAGKLQLTSSGFMSDWTPIAIAVPLAAGAGFELSGQYDFPSVIDLGAVFTYIATPDVQVVGLNVDNVMSAWTTLSVVENMAGIVDNEISVELQFSITDDDPGGSPVWSAWERLTGSEIRSRAIRFRLLLTTTNPKMTPLVSVLSVSIDMPDRLLTGEDISSGLGVKSVVFSPAFKSTRPALNVTGEDMATGDFFTIANLDEDGFDIHFKDSGGGNIDRTFDYIAKGWGAVFT